MSETPEYPYNQANENGSVERGEQPSSPNTSDIKNTLERGLTANGWSLSNRDVSSQPYKFTIEAARDLISLYIYCWRISNGGRGRDNEQRIQIGRYPDDIGFRIGSEDPNQKGLLMGIYQRDGLEPIIVSWKIETNRGHGSSKSCFVTIDTIAEALKDGFVQSEDSDGNIICAFRKEFFNFYIKNLTFLHSQPLTQIISENELIPEDIEDELSAEEELNDFNKESYLKGGTNKIIYGAPGTGKSHSLGTDAIRVTLHPEFTYYDFIGSLKPYKEEGKDLTYKFIPGPFLKALKIAYENPNEMHTLIIEELNRANTAAVFGDLFQLLDRDSDGWSEYSIDNDDILNYLNSELSINIDKIRIPSNLNIWATMNSSDQGVFVMDSAFKRRWEFDYMPISFEGVQRGKEFIQYRKQSITWENFVTQLNSYLTNILEVSEDKLVGPYFLKSEEIKNPQKIANKLLIYLWDDVARHQRDELFSNKYKSFSDLMKAFISTTNGIFTKDLEEQLATYLKINIAAPSESDTPEASDGENIEHE